MTPVLELPPASLALVRQILARHVPEAEVWAYGSRVSGTGHEGSDLDLVLRNPRNLEEPLPAHGKLIEAFQESALPILVDVHDWATLPPAFREEILRLHVCIHPAPGDAPEQQP